MSYLVLPYQVGLNSPRTATSDMDARSAHEYTPFPLARMLMLIWRQQKSWQPSDTDVRSVHGKQLLIPPTSLL
jgi:hypothetical protein